MRLGLFWEWIRALRNTSTHAWPRTKAAVHAKTRWWACWSYPCPSYALALSEKTDLSQATKRKKNWHASDQLNRKKEHYARWRDLLHTSLLVCLRPRRLKVLEQEGWEGDFNAKILWRQTTGNYQQFQKRRRVCDSPSQIKYSSSKKKKKNLRLPV